MSAIAAPLVQFSPVSEKEVHSIVKKTAQNTCELDPLPTLLLYESFDLLLPALTNIINRSLLSSEVPPEFKTAAVKAPLKKASLDSHGNKKTFSPARIFHVYHIS